MIFRNLTIDGDWTFGAGKQNYAKDDKAIALNLKTRLLSWRQDCFFAQDDGVPWFNILGQKSSDYIVLTLKQIIAQTYGITRVTDVQFNLDKNRNATITYKVDTYYTKQLFGQVSV